MTRACHIRVLLRDSCLDAALARSLLTHHPPPLVLVYTATNMKSCDDADRDSSVRRTPLNPEASKSNTPFARDACG